MVAQEGESHFSPEGNKDQDYYHRLKELVSSGKLKIKLIIAPTRSGSTLLEESLSKSPSIDYKCHEPLLAYDAKGAIINPRGYQIMYERANGENLLSSQNQKQLLVKDITHWMYLFGEHQRLFELVDDPVLFLIRNPLIAMESRIRKVSETLPSNLDSQTRDAILRIYGQSLDANYTAEEIFDLYSKTQGWSTWQNLLTFCFTNHNYQPLGDLLNASKSWFNVEAWGSQSLEGQIKYLQRRDRPVTLIDSTEYRLDPAFAAQAICDQWSIKYNNSMINWGEGNINLDPAAASVWFTRIATSSGVQPPTEVLPLISDFPHFIQQQLLHHDVPAYVRLMRNPLRIKNASTNPIKFDFQVPEGEKERLAKLRVIDPDNESTQSLSIDDVDPLFAVCQRPSLLQNEAYLSQKSIYQDVLSIVREMT